MTFKQRIYLRYHELLIERIRNLQKTLSDLRDSSANETKSTAGDKHETALAMLQIEQENTIRQLGEASNLKSVLDKLDPTMKAITICKGSLVKTNKGYLLLCMAMGKITEDHVGIISLSLQSPLGIKLLGLKVGDTAEVNAIKYVIEEIL